MTLPADIQQSVGKQAQQVLVTGNRFQGFDQVRQRHFWSTYRFQPDPDGYIQSGDFVVFQTPQGQIGQGYTRQLSLLETNWPSSNRVPDNQNFEITEVGCSCTQVFVNTEANTESPFKVMWDNYAFANQLLLDNTILNITYLTNTVPLGLCSDFAQAAGPTVGFYAPNAPQAYPLPSYATSPEGFKAAPTDIQRNFMLNGFAAPALRRRFKIPILLQHGETFRFTLSVSPGRGPFMSPFAATSTVDDFPSFCYDLRMDFWATESFIEQS